MYTPAPNATPTLCISTFSSPRYPLFTLPFHKDYYSTDHSTDFLLPTHSSHPSPSLHSMHSYSPLHPRNFPLQTSHPILYTPQHSTNHTSQSTRDIFTTRLAVHTLGSKLHTPHSTPYRLCTTLHTSQFARYTFHFTLKILSP